jgi:hypothetical protein
MNEQSKQTIYKGHGWEDEQKKEKKIEDKREWNYIDD